MKNRGMYIISLLVGLAMGCLLILAVDVAEQWHYAMNEGWDECHVELDGWRPNVYCKMNEE